MPSTAAGLRLSIAGLRKLAVALLVTLPLTPAAAAPAPSEAYRELASAAMAESRLPSLSVAVAVGGSVAHAEAYGLVDVENAVPATPETVYRIGSISKTLTAVATLRLAARGELDLDAPVTDYCAAFPAKEHPITARQLLGHLGGIRHYDYSRLREEFLSTTRYASLAEAIGVFANDPLVAEPGTTYRYSSFGYVLLGCAIEGAVGDPYGEVVRREVLEPAQMSRTVLDVPEQLVPHRAHGYGTADDGSWSNAYFVDLSDKYSAGGWLSTPGDLVRFGRALLEGKLLAPEWLARMWETQQTASGEPTGYGLGWDLGEEACAVYHGGSSVGGSAYLYLEPATQTVVAFATNLELWGDPRHELAVRLTELAAGESACDAP
ncbi:MAG: serine hydrolase domain-containing protein [Thermoanaerobaculia bacterium]